MKSFLTLMALAYVTSASAGVAINHTQPGLEKFVSRGSLITFKFEAFVYGADEHDVSVDFSASPATIEKISGQDFDCANNTSTARCVRPVFPLNSRNSEFDLDVRIPSAPFSGRIIVSAVIRSASGSNHSALGDVIVSRPFPVLNM